VSTEHEEANKE